MILDSVSSGATKTKIMYKAYLSYDQLKEYLSFMEQNEIIRYDGKFQLYRITEKGIKLWHLYQDIDDIMPSPSEINVLKILA